MNLEEVQKLVEAEVLTGELGTEFQTAMASDLMSDVLSFCCPGALLITGLTNSQAVRTADLADLCGVLFVRGKRPSEEMIRLATERGVPLLTTNLSMYEACGILYSNGLEGIKDSKTTDGR